MTNYNDNYEIMQNLVNNISTHIDNLSQRILNGQVFTPEEVQDTIYATNLIMWQMLRINTNNQININTNNRTREQPRRPIAILDLTNDNDNDNNN